MDLPRPPYILFHYDGEMRNPPNPQVAEQVAYLGHRDGWECTWCSRPLNKITGTRDHVIPRSAGGLSHVDNYVLSCALCNSTRGDANAESWERACERARCSPLCILPNGDLDYDMVPIIALHNLGRAKKIRRPRVVRQRSPEAQATRAQANRRKREPVQEIDEKPWQMSPPPIIRERLRARDERIAAETEERRRKFKEWETKRRPRGTARRVGGWMPLGAEQQEDPFMW